jgi:hypothetical protein
MMRWWWLQRARAVTDAWSTEERQTVWRIHLIGMPLFALICIKLALFLFDRSVDPALIAFGSAFCSLVLAFTIARLIALWLWPDLLRRADENAARRYEGYGAD